MITAELLYREASECLDNAALNVARAINKLNRTKNPVGAHALEQMLSDLRRMRDHCHQNSRNGQGVSAPRDPNQSAL